MATLIFWMAGRTVRLASRESALSRPALALTLLVLLQGVLGGFVVWTGKVPADSTIKLVNLATPGRPRIDLDAILTDEAP